MPAEARRRSAVSAVRHGRQALTYQRGEAIHERRGATHIVTTASGLTLALIWRKLLLFVLSPGGKRQKKEEVFSCEKCKHDSKNWKGIICLTLGTFERSQLTIEAHQTVKTRPLRHLRQFSFVINRTI